MLPLSAALHPPHAAPALHVSRRRSGLTPTAAHRSAAAVAVIFATGCGAAAAAPDAGSAGGPPAAEAPAVAVRVAPAATVRQAEVVRAGGVVEARATAELALQVGGRLVALPVEEGARVARGALLAAVDPTDARLALQQAELAAARAADERRRADVLLAAGSIAPNDHERLTYAARQAAVTRDLAAKRLADTRLTAPFAGVIARKASEVGATAAVGAPVVTLVDLDEVRVRAAVPEAEVGRLRVGQPVEVTLDAGAAGAVRGRVSAVGVAADPASRTYAVQVAVPNITHALRAGMVATVAVTTGGSHAAVAVPAAAVTRDADGATLVYVLDRAAGRVRARRVTVGAAAGTSGGDAALVTVGRGLAAGEPVVVAGQQRVRDGARVDVIAGDRPVAAGGQP